MALYHFDSNSPIDELTVERSEGGGIRAYAHAREGASPAQLAALKRALTDHPMQWTPITHSGQPVLEIRGFGRHEETLLQLLKDKNMAYGPYKNKPVIGDNISLWGKIKKNTLRASGLSYFIGDAAFLVYGYKESFSKTTGKLNNPQTLIAGIFYAMGSPFSFFFGRGDKSDFQLKEMAHNIKGELEGKGFIVDKNSSLATVANGHNEGKLNKIRNFFERYPAEITNALFGGAGAMMMWAGIKDYKKFKGGSFELNDTPAMKKARIASAIIDIGIGITTIFAGLTSVFVEEESPNPTAPKKHGFARIWEYIKEKPLRTAGIALGISTAGHTAAAINQYKSGIIENKALAGRAVFAGTNLGAEALMAVSSKGHGKGVKSDPSLEQSAFAVMADLVARQPKEKQEELLATLSESLSHRKHLGGAISDIAEGIRTQLAVVEGNPWAGIARSEPKTLLADDVSSKWRDHSTKPQPAITPSLV